jgi:hypothetical protein
LVGDSCRLASEWPGVINHVGAEDFRRTIAMLQLAYDKHVETSEAKKMADRAADRAAMMAKKREKEVSDG